jgi:hypothetical protein
MLTNLVHLAHPLTPETALANTSGARGNCELLELSPSLQSLCELIFSNTGSQ